MAISVLKSEKMYRVLVRTEEGSERIEIDGSKISRPWYKRLFHMTPTINEILMAISHRLSDREFRLVKDATFPNELLIFEERQVIRSYKFGLVYVGEGQTTEEEMFKNDDSHEKSKKFAEFLSFLGEKIELKGWKGYKGGLDVNSNGYLMLRWSDWFSFHLYHMARL